MTDKPKVWRPGELWGAWWPDYPPEESRSREPGFVRLSKPVEDRHCTVRQIITGDPEDEKRIAELEAAMKDSVELLGVLHAARENDKQITAAELMVIWNRLVNALQSEVRDGE